MIVENFLLEPGPVIPNNPDLPVIVYRQAIDADDRATAFEAAFKRNSWQGVWRDGIYDWHHYHCGAHEALGIAQGEGQVVLGGPGGLAFTVFAGDCLLLPAGTGHCRLTASADFLVVGAYPPGQHADMQSGPADDTMLRAIRDCPVPEHDPVDNAGGAIAKLWRNTR